MTNAPPPIFVTLFGIVTLFKLVQTWKAPSPIFVTSYPSIVLGISTVLLPLSMYFVMLAVPSSNTLYSKLPLVPLVSAPATNGITLNMPITIIADNNTEVILFNFVIIFPPKK